MNEIEGTSSKVALPKLFLWNDPTRYQEYPEALARAEEGRVYSRQEIEQDNCNNTWLCHWNHNFHHSFPVTAAVNISSLFKALWQRFEISA